MVETIVAGVQNRRIRRDLLCSRLAAKNKAKKIMARITPTGKKALNTANPVAFCLKKRNNGGPRNARSRAEKMLSRVLQICHNMRPHVFNQRILLN